MWFTRDQFALCYELKALGLEPRFEPGDLVARGFADLGFEEFQVLPGPRLLSLTAGSVTPLAQDGRAHFFWIPSSDEAVDLIERCGARIGGITRINQREWACELVSANGLTEVISSRHLYTLSLLALKVALSIKPSGD